MKTFGDLKNGDKLYITNQKGETDVCHILDVHISKQVTVSFADITYVDKKLNVRGISLLMGQTTYTQSVNGLLVTFSSCEESVIRLYERNISELSQKLDEWKDNFRKIMKINPKL